MRVLSLGWGVQSTTLAVMAALGDIEPLIAVHADTRHERSGTYEYAKRMTPWLTARGLQVETVMADATPLADKWGGVSVPAFGDEGGQIKRQCTYDWKIAPIRRWIRTHRTDKTQVAMIMGISLDEIERMRDSNVQYIRNVYPLVDMRMRRDDCVTYLEQHDVPVPPRSACVFCPFQSTREWRSVQAVSHDWQKAVDADADIRVRRLKGGIGEGKLYVHRSRRPLVDVDLRSEQERGQLDMFSEECSGVCFV